MSEQTYVLLQARLNSSRLYQKSLLPICGKSLVEFCYKNIFFSKNNFVFVVLIPNNKKSYLLEKDLIKKNIKYFKGSEKNVLLRFSQFLKKKSKDSNVIRLTADNPFVDREFIKFCFKIYKKNKLEYFHSHENLKNTPYGLSLEIFKTEKIFESINHSKSKINQEHVTPYIKKKYLKNIKFNCEEFKQLKSKLKLSIDTFDDYNKIKNIFEVFGKINFKQLNHICKKKVTNNFNKKQPSKILMGTVQLGKKYFTNSQISQKKANILLNLAVKKKINFLDTASDYGHSEKFIGNFIRKSGKPFFISTKLTSVYHINNKDEIKEKVTESIINSLSKLHINSIEYFFIHEPKDFRNKIVIEEINKFKKTGLIKKLGISIYSPEDLELLKTNSFDAVQIPLNIFDHKFLKFINSNTKYEVFVRSIFLRGNIKSNKIILPKSKYNYLINFFKNFIEKKNYKNYFHLTFSFIKYLKRIDYIIIGFQSKYQFSVLTQHQKSEIMKKKDFLEIQKIIKTSKIEKDIDLRYW